MLKELMKYGVRIIPGLPALYIPAEDMIVLADLHLGFESEASKSGIHVPRLQLKKSIELIMKLTENVSCRKLLINGDLKHTFEKLTIQEREEVSIFLSKAKDYFTDIILVRGNHDNYVSIVTERFDVDLREQYATGNVLFVHGHKNINDYSRYKVIVIGHEHPALKISDELGAFMKLPCFLATPGKHGEIILVLPAAGYYQTGNEVTLEPSNYLSPIMQSEGLIEEAVPILFSEGLELLEFPALKYLKSRVV